MMEWSHDLYPKWKAFYVMKIKKTARFFTRNAIPIQLWSFNLCMKYLVLEHLFESFKHEVFVHFGHNLSGYLPS